MKQTRKKINSISANYVTTNTAQTITGKKTLSTTNNTEVIRVKVTNTDSAVTPTENLWTNVISCYDKNDKLIGNLQFTKRTDGSHWVGLEAAARNSNGNNIYHSLGIALKADGTASTSAPNPASNSNDTSIATTAWVNSKISTGGGSNPVGTIIPFAGSSIPAGYLLCNGAAVSRTTYANLFGVISTLYGAGDGSTTFNLPDLRDRFLEGAGTNAIGRYLSAGLPNITGTTKGDSFRGQFPFYWLSDGAFSTRLETLDNGTIIAAYDSTVGYNKMSVIAFDASKSNTIYNASLTVQPSAMTVQYLIKY